MAFVLRWARLALLTTTLIFLPLVGAAIWFGQYLPLDLANWFAFLRPCRPKTLDRRFPYILFHRRDCPHVDSASTSRPLGRLLPVRGPDRRSAGVLFSGSEIKYPAFIGWNVPQGAGFALLFPILFITVACGACSGFHFIIASGTSLKQLAPSPTPRKSATAQCFWKRWSPSSRRRA